MQAEKRRLRDPRSLSGGLTASRAQGRCALTLLCPVSSEAQDPLAGQSPCRARVPRGGAALTRAPLWPQCVDNIRCNGLMMNAFEENSKVTVPQMIK